MKLDNEGWSQLGLNRGESNGLVVEMQLGFETKIVWLEWWKTT
jgi:hypothetical protein